MDIIDSRAHLLHLLTDGSKYPLGTVIHDAMHESLTLVNGTCQRWRVPPLSVLHCIFYAYAGPFLCNNCSHLAEMHTYGLPSSQSVKE